MGIGALVFAQIQGEDVLTPQEAVKLEDEHRVNHHPPDKQSQGTEQFDRLDIILYYLGFIIFLEFMLRITSPIFQLFSGGNSGSKPEPAPAGQTPATADAAD